MPEQSPIPQQPYANLEGDPLKLGFDQLEQAYSLALVRETFDQYSSVRHINQEKKWASSDALYFGYLPQRVWEGTNVPRSSWSNQLVYDHVEGSLSIIQQALFAQPEWFDVEADFGSTPQQARQQRAHLNYLLEGNGYDVTSFQTEMELALKDMLLYGNGGVILEYDPVKKRPVVQWLDIHDLYVDPGTPTPHIDKARSVIRRSRKTVDELLAWEGSPGVRLPTKSQLYGMAANGVPWTTGDQSVQLKESLQGQQYFGQPDMVSLPADKRIEVLTYYSPTRIIMVLNREWVMYSERNPYECIPMAFAPYSIVAGKWHALSVSDIQERNQRVSEALVNARLDELALIVNPPRVTKASSTYTPSQQRWGPGRSIRAGNPKEDVIFPASQNATANIYAEVDYIDKTADKRSGVSSLGMGVPRPGNANRTASGMQMQLEGGMSRIQVVVKHVEDYLIIPLLHKIIKMLQVHNQAEFLPGMDGGQQQIVPAQVLKSKTRFKITAASKMMTRDRLGSMFPVLMQFFVQGPFLGEIQKTGQTLDWNEVFQMLSDATGTGKLYQFIRPLSQQEQQAMNQPPPQVQAQMQMEQQKMQMELQKEQIKKQPDPQQMQMEQQKAQLEMAKSQQKLETDQILAQMKIQMEQMKLEIEKQKAQLKLQLEEAKIQQGARKAQLDTDNAALQGALKVQQAQVDAEMKSRHNEESHSVKMKQAEELAEQKEKLKPKPKPNSS